jgi:hypothetical protein
MLMMPVRSCVLVRSATPRSSLDVDREYRKGIHAMETLRLRRAKIMEAGFGVSELVLSVFEY